MMHNRAGRKLRRNDAASPGDVLQSAPVADDARAHPDDADQGEGAAAPGRAPHHDGKNDGVAARRKVARWIPDRTTVKKVFENLAPRFVDRPGGYTRILRLGARKGDAAEAAILEFVDYQVRGQGEGAAARSPCPTARGAPRAAESRPSARRSRRGRGGRGDGEAAPKKAPARKPAAPRRASRAACRSRRPRRARAARVHPSGASRDGNRGRGDERVVRGRVSADRARGLEPRREARALGSRLGRLPPRAHFLAVAAERAGRLATSRASTRSSTACSTAWRRCCSTAAIRWPGRRGFSSCSRVLAIVGALAVFGTPTRRTRRSFRGVPWRDGTPSWTRRERRWGRSSGRGGRGRSGGGVEGPHRALSRGERGFLRRRGCGESARPLSPRPLPRGEGVLATARLRRAVTHFLKKPPPLAAALPPSAIMTRWLSSLMRSFSWAIFCWKSRVAARSRS